MSAPSPDKTKDAGQKAAASSGQDSSDDEDIGALLSKGFADTKQATSDLLYLGYTIKYQIAAHAQCSPEATDDLARLADGIHTGFNIYEMLENYIHEFLNIFSEMIAGFYEEGGLDGIIKCNSDQQGAGISGVSGDHDKNVSEKDAGLDLNELKQKMEGFSISGVSADYAKNVSEKDAGLDLNELKQGLEGFGISGLSDDSVKKLFGKDGAMDINKFKQGMEAFQTVKNILKQQKEDIVKMMTSALQSGGATTGKMNDTKAKLGGEKN